LIPLNDWARYHRKLLESLARTSTEGVSVEIVDDPQPLCNGTGVVRLPKSLFEPGNERELILTWTHELAHARDCIDHGEYVRQVLRGNGQYADADEIEALKNRLEKRALRAEQNTGLRLDDPDWWIDRSI
jgi:hypothetical protein